MKAKIIPITILILSLSGCVSLNSVSITQIPKKRSKPVSAVVSKTIFLGFNFDNDFVDALTMKLYSKCKSGRVSGILTKDQITNYLFVHTRKVIAKGYCQ